MWLSTDASLGCGGMSCNQYDCESIRTLQLLLLLPCYDLLLVHDSLASRFVHQNKL